MEDPNHTQKQAVIEGLEMIPLLGKPLAWMYKFFGTAGLVSFLGGGVVIAGLIFFGQYPTGLIAESLKSGEAQASQPAKPPLVNANKEVDNAVPPPTLALTGYVYDIFGNPLEEEVIIMPSGDRYASSDKKGVFTFQDVPFQNQLSLEIARHPGRQKIQLRPNDVGTTRTVSDTLVKNPLTQDLDPVLCASMPELEPVGEFYPIQDDHYQIRLKDLKEKDPESGLHFIWCRVTLFGAEDYGLNKDLNLIFDWYHNNQGPVTFSNEVELKPYGWRYRANKKVWPGDWKLVIRTKYRELESIRFTIRK